MGKSIKYSYMSNLNEICPFVWSPVMMCYKHKKSFLYKPLFRRKDLKIDLHMYLFVSSKYSLYPTNWKKVKQIVAFRYVIFRLFLHTKMLCV